MNWVPVEPVPMTPTLRPHDLESVGPTAGMDYLSRELFGTRYFRRVGFGEHPQGGDQVLAPVNLGGLGAHFPLCQGIVPSCRGDGGRELDIAA